MGEEKPLTNWADRLKELRSRLQMYEPRGMAEMAKMLGIEEADYKNIEEGIREPNENESDKIQKLVHDLTDTEGKSDRIIELAKKLSRPAM